MQHSTGWGFRIKPFLYEMNHTSLDSPISCMNKGHQSMVGGWDTSGLARSLRVGEYEDSTRVLVTECGNGRPPRHLTDYYQIPPGPGRSQIFVDFRVNNEKMHMHVFRIRLSYSAVVDYPAAPFPTAPCPGGAERMH